MFFEKWDILDRNGRFLGRTTLRGKAWLKPGEYHLVVHIWVISEDNKILIQKRSENKMLMPGEWAATGGAAISGEDSFTAASRELFEELGISSSRENLNLGFRIKRRNSLLDVWFIKTDLKTENLRLQESEVAEVKSVSLPQLKAMVEKGEFHNYGKEYFEKVFSNMEKEFNL